MRPISAGLTIIPIETPSRGDRSYVVHDDNAVDDTFDNAEKVGLHLV